MRFQRNTPDAERELGRRACGLQALSSHHAHTSTAVTAIGVNGGKFATELNAGS
jgi:hypothetical protein